MRRTASLIGLTLGAVLLATTGSLLPRHTAAIAAVPPDAIARFMDAAGVDDVAFEQALARASAAAPECIGAQAASTVAVEPPEINLLGEEAELFARTEGFGHALSFEHALEGVRASAARDRAATKEGCSGKDSASTSPRSSSAERRLHEAMDRAFAEVETDSRIAELEHAWSRCMAREGYTFTSYYDLHAELTDALDEAMFLVARAGAGLRDLDMSPLDELRAVEVSLAPSHLRCSPGGVEVGGRPVAVAEHVAVYEERFVREHHALLEQVRTERVRALEQLDPSARRGRP